MCISWCFFFLVCVSGIIARTASSPPIGSRTTSGTRMRSRGLRAVSSRLCRISGGSLVDEESMKEEEEEEEEMEKKAVDPGPVSIIVSTTVGSSYLDKKRRISINRNSTVRDLKEQLSLRFPGSPPIALQKLYFGLRKLGDEESMGNITSLTPVPLHLDMITGASVYNKTMSISQAIEAYASLVVQQAYVGKSLAQLFSEVSKVSEGEETNEFELKLGTSHTETENENEEIVVFDTSLYGVMFRKVNSSLHERYAEDIQLALIEEREPEENSADTAAWRNEGNNKKPLTKALAKEFDMNWKSMKNYVYLSVLLGIFAKFGTTTAGASKFLILMVPFLWVSKLRQLRIVFKLLLYVVLPMISRIDFLMPLLPAPYQTIAVELSEDVFGAKSPIIPTSSSSRPIVPTAKNKNKQHQQTDASLADDRVGDKGGQEQAEYDDDYSEDEEDEYEDEDGDESQESEPEEEGELVEEDDYEESYTGSEEEE